MLVTVGLNWDQKQDEERSRTDQQGRSNSLWRGNEQRLLFIRLVGVKVIELQDHQQRSMMGKQDLEGERRGTVICVDANLVNLNIYEVLRFVSTNLFG